MKEKQSIGRKQNITTSNKTQIYTNKKKLDSNNN